MENKPKVSVIIPAYNVEKYLEECLLSVINQTLKDIEIIIINDGSTDKTHDIINLYKKRDIRIISIDKKNEGQSIARNIGLSISSGEYIYFMDSDDYIEINTLEECYRKSKNEDLDFVLFDSDIFFETKDLEKKYGNYKKNREKKLSNQILSGSEVLKKLYSTKKYGASVCVTFIKKEYLDKNSLNFYPKIIHEDELFTFLLFYKAKRVNYIEKNFFKRRLRKNSTMTQVKTEKNTKGYLVVTEELCKLKYMEKDENKKILINKMIEIVIGGAISTLTYLDNNRRKYYREKIEKEYKEYINFSNQIKLKFPWIFERLKKINNLLIRDKKKIRSRI